MNEEIRNIKTYINDISIKEGYEDAITVEHRSNNTKRDFLFVNRFQCKHLPSDPLTMIRMCKDLANVCNNNIKDISKQKILVISFAETATAIGKFVTRHLKNCIYSMSTTRENIADSIEVIRFEEEHSHATTQKLLFYNNEAALNELMHNITYILFIDDEITTGKTILNFINAFKSRFPSNIKFGVASICNWQNEDNKKLFIENNIDRLFLISGHIKDESAKMNLHNGVHILNDVDTPTKDVNSISSIYRSDNSDIFRISRLGYLASESAYYERELKEIYADIIFRQLENNSCSKRIRIVGSEECMAFTIELGSRLRDIKYEVLCHSTTRSKIDVLTDISSADSRKYIVNRLAVASAYDQDRCTYIYNTTEKTDLVVIISDSTNNKCFTEFAASLADIFKHSTNRIVAYRI